MKTKKKSDKRKQKKKDLNNTDKSTNIIKKLSICHLLFSKVFTDFYSLLFKNMELMLKNLVITLIPWK